MQALLSLGGTQVNGAAGGGGGRAGGAKPNDTKRKQVFTDTGRVVSSEGNN